MKISILNPAPKGSRQKHWGDYHFGQSLMRAFEQSGVSAESHYWPEWEPADDADAVIVLRGRRRIIPTDAKRPWLMWAISHPSDISLEEINAFTIVCPASETFCDKLKAVARVPVVPLRQCTDSRIFYMNGEGAVEPLDRSGMLFIANSRNVRRQMMQWAANTGLRPVLVGQGWETVEYKDLVLAEYVDNDKLPGLYRQFQLGLNDHWGDMRYYGIISNRILDCLASGLPVLTDWFPELERVFGDGLLYANSEHSYWDAVWSCKTRYLEHYERAREVWCSLEESFSFEVRVGEITELLNKVPVEKKNLKKPSQRRFPISRFIDGEKKGPSHFLHVQPTLPLAKTLGAVDGVLFTRVGLGLGPWSIDIDRQASQLPTSLYDGVILDEAPLGEDLKAEDFDRLVSGIIHSMKLAAPILVVSSKAADNDSYWTDAVIRTGLQSGQSLLTDGWRIEVFQKTE